MGRDPKLPNLPNKLPKKKRYATDINKPPLGEKKMRWPNKDPYDGFFHDLFPSWKEFWSSDYIRDTDVSEPVEAEVFLMNLRRGSQAGKIRVN